jgi:hypothetical protein
MESGSIQSLPISRDVRLNVRLRKLVPVREIREELKVVQQEPVQPPKFKKSWKEKVKPAIDNEDKQEKMEINNGIT